MDIIDKINLYSHTSDDIRDMEIFIEMSMLVDDNMSLNEAFNLSVLKSTGKSLLKSIGIHQQKTGDGLIQVALKSGKLMAEFVYHSLKGAIGNKKSIDRVKELANTEITKEQFLDFLLKLDMATLHIISGPLHAIDAWTGWHIWANIKTKSEDVVKKAKNAIQNLIDASKNASDDVKNKLKSLMHGIARLFGIEDLLSDIKKV